VTLGIVRRERLGPRTHVTDAITASATFASDDSEGDHRHMYRGFMALAQPTIKSFAALLALCAVTVTVADLPSSTASPEEDTAAHATVMLGSTTRQGRAENLAPGDTVANLFDVNLSPRNGKRMFVNVVALSGRSSVLDTNASNGLRLSIERCGRSRGWTKHRAKPQFTCSGQGTVVLSPIPVAQAKNRLLALPALRAGQPAHLLLKFSLPSSAGNTFEGRVSSLRLTFLTRP
jgi:hypothetical protein